MSTTAIRRVQAWEVLDSRGHPTVCARVQLAGGAAGKATAPSGASTGRHEVPEGRDGEVRYGGLGVRQLCQQVESRLAPLLTGVDAADPAAVQTRLRQADGPTASAGNVTTAISVASMLAAAADAEREPWQHLSRVHRSQPRLPVPMINIVSGGAHANRSIDIQDVLVVPVGATSFGGALEVASGVRASAFVLAEQRGATPWLVADEGGLSLPGARNEDALELVTEAIDKAGYQAGVDAALAVDVAANEIVGADGYRINGRTDGISSDELVARIRTWCQDFPIVSLEDPLHDTDLAGWAKLAAALSGQGLQLLGDDLIGTQHHRVAPSQQAGVNAVLVKINQAGTVHGAWTVVQEAQARGMATVLSSRSGETEESWLADIAVGWGCGQVKVGSLTRSERTAKWNRLLEIEHRWRDSLAYAGREALAGRSATREVPR